MSIILHITKKEDWAKAQATGSYRAESLASQGFIHCSTPAQVVAVANFIFRGQRDLVLLVIDSARVIAEVRLENLDGGNSAQNDDLPDDKLYPHIYGPLNVDAVTLVVDFDPLPDGTFELPESFSG